MKKPYILISSILISSIVFFVLLQVFLGVKEYIVQQYQPNYITPSPKDSLYMELLQNPSTRPYAIEVGKTVQDFYFITDSIKTILDAKIDPRLISDIIISKGIAQEIKNGLLKLDSSEIILCKPSCLDSIYKNDETWLKVFEENDPKEIRTFVQEKIDKVVLAEKEALLKIKTK